jgi:hypothetical protein
MGINYPQLKNTVVELTTILRNHSERISRIHSIMLSTHLESHQNGAKQSSSSTVSGHKKAVSHVRKTAF